VGGEIDETERGKLPLSQKYVKQHREPNGSDEPPFMPVQKFQHWKRY
jgi:hypothetical protein